jgi:hypothetical protein
MNFEGNVGHKNTQLHRHNLGMQGEPSPHPQYFYIYSVSKMHGSRTGKIVATSPAPAET